MEPDSIQFDRNVISIHYPKRPQTRSWWDAAAIHQFDWLPKCQTEADVIAHFLSEIPASRRHSKREMQAHITSEANFKKCGKGIIVRLNHELAGLAVAGGRDSIYLVSHQGKAGALRVWSSKYQQYPLRGFKIGAIGDWPDFLQLSAIPIELEIIEEA